MKKIAVIGCGGINSWFVHHLYEMTQTFGYDVYVKLFDNDVVEEKNLLRSNQNFVIDNLMLPKAEVLAKRYNFDFENVFITKDNLKLLEPFDDLIIGVDNHKVRQMLYEYGLITSKFVLDMRSQGTQMAFIMPDPKKGMDYYNQKFFSNMEVMERRGSCQLQSDIDKDTIKTGNRIIAYFGCYGIYLANIRGDKVSTDEWSFAY